MSKLAKKPLIIPNNVKINILENKVVVEGPLGKLEVQLQHPQYVSLRLEEQKLYVDKKEDTKEGKMFQGLYFALIRNAIKGVSEGYKKSLEVVGVGYQAQLQGNNLVLKLGFSSPVNFEIPQGVKITVDQKGQEITVSGIDKYLVGETAAKIRRIKPPEPYKGTGIRYKGEHISLKPGKAAIAGGKK